MTPRVTQSREWRSKQAWVGFLIPSCALPLGSLVKAVHKRGQSLFTVSCAWSAPSYRVPWWQSNSDRGSSVPPYARWFQSERHQWPYFMEEIPHVSREEVSVFWGFLVQTLEPWLTASSRQLWPLSGQLILLLFVHLWNRCLVCLRCVSPKQKEIRYESLRVTFDRDTHHTT